MSTERDEVSARVDVINDVLAERERQDVKWGEQNHPNGTGYNAVCMPALLPKNKTYGDEIAYVVSRQWRIV